MPLAPIPFHLLRNHHAPLSALHFSPSNTHLYAGDQDGFVSITDLKIRRVVVFWKAHEGGVLGLEEWDSCLISHGRDNSIHFYNPLSRSSLGAASGSGKLLDPPKVARSIATNSLNFCRFSLAPLPKHSSVHIASQSSVEGVLRGNGKEREALLAVPSLLNSETADIYHIPSLRRLHSSINKDDLSRISGSCVPPLSNNTDVVPSCGEISRTGLIMTLHLAIVPSDDVSTSTLTLIMGFEDGRVETWQFCPPLTSAESPVVPEKGPGCLEESDCGAEGSRIRWNRLYSCKRHNEAVMAMVVDRQMNRAFTVSADHLLCRYNLNQIFATPPPALSEDIVSAYSVKQIGNSALALSADDKVIAVGGWDGRIRLFSTATFKPLGTLSYHRETVHVLSFGNPMPSLPEESGDDDEESIAETEEIAMGIDDDTDDEGIAGGTEKSEDRVRWLASGGKDTSVALWSLMDFSAR